MLPARHCTAAKRSAHKTCVALQHGSGEGGADAAGRSSDSGREFLIALSLLLLLLIWKLIIDFTF